MILLQFDECFTSKKIRARCEAEGKSAIKTFPHRLRNKAVKDPEVVDRFLPGESSLVTTDHRLPIKEAARIPNQHAGIIVVRHNGPHTQREKDIIQVIENFKSHVQQWENLNWANSVVELYQDRVEIYAIENGTRRRSVVVSFVDAAFEQDLIQTLAANAVMSSEDHVE